MKRNAKKIKSRKKAALAFAIILVSIPAALPLLHPGFFHFSDEPHIADLFQMYKAISSGQFPPRWAPDMLYGFGYPLFNFYYPLPFYIGSLFYSLTGSLISSVKLLEFITIPFSVLGMYLWLNKHTDRFAAFTGGLVYLYTSYRAVDLYVRGAIGENFSFMIAPFVALIIYEVVNDRSYKKVALLGSTLGLFILGHNLAPIMFLPWLGIYGLALSFNKKDFKALLRVITGFVIGLGIGAYWWLPAFLEKGLLAGQTPFNYLDHFPFIKQLVYSPFGYGASNPGMGDDISLQVGIANWTLLILSFYSFFKIKKDKRILLCVFIAGILGSLFLMNIRSVPLWEAFSLSPYIQFPWRFLLMTTFLTSSLVIFINFGKRLRKVVLAAIALLAFFSTLGYFKPSEYYSPNDKYFLDRFFADAEGDGSEVTQDYKNYSEDYLLLPKTAVKKPSLLPESKFTSSTVYIEKVIERSAVDYIANVKGEGFVYFNSLYFPGWYVESNGYKLIPFSALPYGQIAINVDKNISTIHVYWRETPLRKAADTISFAFLLFAGSLFYRKKRRDGKK